MKFDLEKHHRRSTRLPSYDYSRPGHYFVTLCSHLKECIFGEIVEGKLIISEFGKIVEVEWLRTPEIRKNIRLDSFVLMPNHFHAIIEITSQVNRRGVLQYAPTTQRGKSFGSPSQTLGAMMRGFKGASTKQVNILRGTPGVPLWQRNYYEHVIRDQEDIARIREYIRANPWNWLEDEENPNRRKI